ncbi:putative ORfan [Saudi moumouvirus]|nr:putative ORfan [Saudi moumouvirus]
MSCGPCGFGLGGFGGISGYAYGFSYNNNFGGCGPFGGYYRGCAPNWGCNPCAGWGWGGWC